MLRKIDHNDMGHSNLGWLQSIFHFSFAEYYNPHNLHFGVLRVLNDDLIHPEKGFSTHPHNDMEIISYIVEGFLTHGDSMGNMRTLTRGHVQYMSAGTGVYHSEYNNAKQMCRILQIWILPDKKGHTPDYGDLEVPWDDRKNKWLHIVSDKNGSAPVKIFQDANIYVMELDKDKEISFPVHTGRQAYLVQIEGIALINNEELNARDALEIKAEILNIKAIETSHLLVIEMKG